MWADTGSRQLQCELVINSSHYWDIIAWVASFLCAGLYSSHLEMLCHTGPCPTMSHILFVNNIDIAAVQDVTFCHLALRDLAANDIMIKLVMM